jgi:hypothetical protein
MDAKQNPFSLYDFLGYFVPGAFFNYTMLLSCSHIQADIAPFSIDTVSRYLSFEKPENYIPFVIISYIVGHLLSLLSSISVEQFAIWQFGYPSKFLLGYSRDGYYAVETEKALQAVIRTLVWLFILPVSLLDITFGKFLGMRFFYTKQLDKLLVAIIKKKTLSIVKSQAEIAQPSEHGKAREHDFFRYIYHYVLENAPYHGPKIQNYVALYGFLRTLTFIFVCYFWIIVYHMCASTMPMAAGLKYLITVSVLTYVFFMGFMKFYRRYSLEALMAAAVVHKKESSEKQG